MDIRYGVDVSNKFDIIGFNDDAAEAAKQKEEARKSKKPLVEGDKSKLGSNKQNTKKSTPHSENKGKQNDQIISKKDASGKDSQQNERSNRGGRRDREGRDNKENDGERKPFMKRPPKEQQENRGVDENVPPEFREKPEGSRNFNRFDDGERGRGRGRGRGGFRGRGRGGERGGFGQPFGGKRDFDRHSGSDKTGVKAVDKREGGGRRNWGSYKDDIKNIEESIQTNTEGTEPVENWNQNEETTEPQENSEAAPGATETVNEEDAAPKQMTLKEYRASQVKNRYKSQFQIRKAGEGVDDSQWKTGTKVINKPVSSSAPKPERRRKTSGSEEEDSGDEDHEERKKKNKNMLNIEITFNDNNRRGGRGGRRGRGVGRGFYRGGSPRGGSGRGGERKYREAAPRVDDEKDFPSLVKSVA